MNGTRHTANGTEGKRKRPHNDSARGTPMKRLAWRRRRRKTRAALNGEQR